MPATRLMEGRILPRAFWLARPWLSLTPRAVYPDFWPTTPARALRGFLNAHGYRAHGWK